MRNIHGVLFLDKVSGVSSAFLLYRIKVLFGAKKVGHTGTLDPLATGMLPICFGEATKFSKYLLDSNKSYRVVAKLGERTNTFDSYGFIIDVRPVQLDRVCLSHVLGTFVGEYYQVPPMFSALKYHGRPLYRYARQGINISRSSRLVQIYRIDLIRCNNRYIELEVFCSKGTYIRSFIDDLGKCLGCGAHVVSLRRIALAQFSSELMINLSVLQQCVDCHVNRSRSFKKLDALLYPIDILVAHFPEINVSFDICRLLRFGQRVKINDITVGASNSHEINNGLVRMTVGEEKKFFGLGNVIDKKYLLVQRLLVF